jgi:hypothetical protein
MNKLPREISNHNPLIVSTGKNENLPHSYSLSLI